MHRIDFFRLIPRTQMITQMLMSKGIMSKDKLLEAWDSDKKCKFIFIFAVIRFLL